MPSDCASRQWLSYLVVRRAHLSLRHSTAWFDVGSVCWRHNTVITLRHAPSYHAHPSRAAIVSRSMTSCCGQPSRAAFVLRHMGKKKTSFYSSWIWSWFVMIWFDSTPCIQAKNLLWHHRRYHPWYHANTDRACIQRERSYSSNSSRI